MISLKLHSNFIEITLRHGCSPVNLVHTFRTIFPKNTSGRGFFWKCKKTHFESRLIDDIVSKLVCKYTTNTDAHTCSAKYCYEKCSKFTEKHLPWSSLLLELLLFSCQSQELLQNFAAEHKSVFDAKRLWWILFAKIVNGFYPLTIFSRRLHHACLFVLACLFFFFCLGFLSRTFTNHRTAGEEGRCFFNTSLPLAPASQTLRH